MDDDDDKGFAERESPYGCHLIFFVALFLLGLAMIWVFGNVWCAAGPNRC